MGGNAAALMPYPSIAVSSPWRDMSCSREPYQSAILSPRWDHGFRCRGRCPSSGRTRGTKASSALGASTERISAGARHKTLDNYLSLVGVPELEREGARPPGQLRISYGQVRSAKHKHTHVHSTQKTYTEQTHGTP